jgi:hypothetical protein
LPISGDESITLKSVISHRNNTSGLDSTPSHLQYSFERKGIFKDVNLSEK